MGLPNPVMDAVPFTPLTAEFVNDMIENIESLSDGSGLSNDSISSDSLFTDSVSPVTRSSELIFDHVASGVVLAGTGYGSTLAWTLSSGIVYINGKRLTYAGGSGNVTASKDTYFDLLDNGDGTAVLVNTGGNIVSNNAASPSLAANSVRIGIIVSGGSSIASVAAVNQGQENKVLPIASSIAYTVTDSLGNLICPRDPNRKLLGYRQILSTFTTTSGTAVQVTGLSCPVIVPTGRKVKIKLFCGLPYNTTSGAFNTFSIWDGVVGVGTRIQQTDNYVNTGNTGNNSVPEIVVTPTSASKTYNAGLQVNTATGGIQAQTIQPAFISVELV